jgi:hypothetical protein
MQRHASFVPQASTGAPNWRGSDVGVYGGPFCSDARYYIDPFDDFLGQSGVNENYYAQANLYFRDSTITAAYRRTVAGAPAYPASPSGNAYPWGGGAGVYPGILFMVGQMEGVVSPYPGVAPPAPTNFRVTVP